MTMYLALLHSDQLTDPTSFCRGLPLRMTYIKVRRRASPGNSRYLWYDDQTFTLHCSSQERCSQTHVMYALSGQVYHASEAARPSDWVAW